MPQIDTAKYPTDRQWRSRLKMTRHTWHSLPEWMRPAAVTGPDGKTRITEAPEAWACRALGFQPSQPEVSSC